MTEVTKKKSSITQDSVDYTYASFIRVWTCACKYQHNEVTSIVSVVGEVVVFAVLIIIAYYFMYNNAAFECAKVIIRWQLQTPTITEEKLLTFMLLIISFLLFCLFFSLCCS